MDQQEHARSDRLKEDKFKPAPTPTGMREKLRLTRAFLSRKEGEFEQLRHTIAALKNELADHAR